MTILLLNQFFWPDSAATGQLLTDLANFLYEQGHDVEVICGPDGYSGLLNPSPEPQVTVHRTPGFRFSRNVVGRLLSYFSFVFFAFFYAVRVRKPELVITMTTPPLLSMIGRFLARFRGSRHYIWEMDLYPDVATDVNVLKKNGLATRLIGSIADSAREHADGVIVLGECMRDRLLARGIDSRRVHIAENWADAEFIHPVPFRSDGQLCLLYSGNLGLAHDIETVEHVMKALNHDDRFRFLFIGEGIRTQELKSWCQANAIRNVTFLPFQDRDRLSESLGSGDIGLVTLKDGCSGSVVPSKTYSLLAAGRPVLFVGPRSSTPARIIERFQCGWQVANGDVKGFTALLEVLASQPSLIRQAGERSRAAFLQRYDLPVGVSRLCGVLGIPTTSTRASKPAKLRIGEKNPKWGRV